ncbi:MAG: GGDEF domain-containing protein [Fimbriimonadaceae bacterium]|nr:GGDEF domain-containing protein [Alphaproteobacteria bacterium]
MMTLLKAGIVALLSVVVSLVVTYAALKLFNGEVFVVGFAIGTIVPLLVAFPVTYYIERQRKTLAAAHLALKESHTQLANLHREMERKSKLDFMTGILNREHFLSSFDRRRRKSDRGCLLVIDADHFKQVNDTYGHPIGDKALLAIVVAITSTVRDEDIVGRIGGEEFAVFLANTNTDEAFLIAERIRLAVECIDFNPRDQRKHPLSVSIGGAAAGEDAGWADLMRIADERLYDAKRSGRNKVVFSSEHLESETTSSAS